jgi:hypothetical protein
VRRLGWITEDANIALQAAALHPEFSALQGIQPKIQDKVWESLVELAITTGIPHTTYSKEVYEGLVRSQIAAVREQLRSSAKIPALDFWKSCSHTILHPLARNILCVPAASTAMERGFSSTGFIMNRREGRLSLATMQVYAIIRDYILQEDYEFAGLMKAISTVVEQEQK